MVSQRISFNTPRRICWDHVNQEIQKNFQSYFGTNSLGISSLEKAQNFVENNSRTVFPFQYFKHTLMLALWIVNVWQLGILLSGWYIPITALLWHFLLFSVTTNFQGGNSLTSVNIQENKFVVKLVSRCCGYPDPEFTWGPATRTRPGRSRDRSCPRLRQTALFWCWCLFWWCSRGQWWLAHCTCAGRGFRQQGW